VKTKQDAFSYLAAGGWRVMGARAGRRVLRPVAGRDPAARAHHGSIVDLEARSEARADGRTVGNGTFTHWAATWTVPPAAAGAAIARSRPAAMQAEAMRLQWTLVTKVAGPDATPGYGPAFDKLHEIVGCIAPSAGPQP
jgi:hypothetical protein